MPHYTQFTTADGQTIWIEIDEAEQVQTSGEVVRAGLGETVKQAASKVQTTFEEALDTIRYSAETIIGKIRRLTDAPDEVEVIFGLKAIGEAGGTFAVAKAGIEANYTVKLIWKREPITGEKRTTSDK